MSLHYTTPPKIKQKPLNFSFTSMAHIEAEYPASPLLCTAPMMRHFAQITVRRGLTHLLAHAMLLPGEANNLDSTINVPKNLSFDVRIVVRALLLLFVVRTKPWTRAH
jgi:hypothetical protein